VGLRAALGRAPLDHNTVWARECIDQDRAARGEPALASKYNPVGVVEVVEEEDTAVVAAVVVVVVVVVAVDYSLANIDLDVAVAADVAVVVAAVGFAGSWLPN
jgi:hypothetical protein